MTLAEFIAEFRRVRDDTKPDYLWSDEEITSYLNDAVNEACERALLIEDRTTADVCTVSLSIGEPNYPIHDSIIKIKRVTLGGARLPETSVEAMDEEETFWENRSGKPTRFIRDGETSIRVVPTPVEAADLSMTVYRTPLEPLVVDRPDESPEIKSIYHYRLLPWVYRCALLKQDAETLDKDRALEQEILFTFNFGVRPDANVQRKHRDRNPPLVSMVSW